MATLEFLGAAGTVTGSKHLVEAGGRRILVDCGLYQGLKALRLRNWERLPVDPASIDWVVLTHGHIDHSGYVPRLVKDGFKGRVLATRATADLLWPDSGHLQEEEALSHNKRGTSKHRPALPLYTAEEGLAAAALLLAGYQALGTRGRQLQERATSLKIYGEEIPVRAHLETVHGLSAHADSDGLMRWLRTAGRPPERAFAVHGDPGPAQALATRIEKELGWAVDVPAYRDRVTIE